MKLRLAPELDHVFICCAAGAPEAAMLAHAGLTEGSTNTHPGQGTASRRFFFQNAYLELLWVSDPEEAQSERARPTRLWERWSKRRAGACPLGVVLRPGAQARDRPPPFATWSYHPQYLPPDLAIEIATGTPLSEPELFNIRFARRPDEIGREPTPHAIPLMAVTGLRIGLAAAGPCSPAAQSTEAAGVASFTPAAEYVMTLAFDGETRGKTVDLRRELPLVLEW
jgi:hypothetical protein